MDPSLLVCVYSLANSLGVIGHGAMPNVKCLTYLVHAPPISIEGKTGKSNKQLQMNRALLGGTPMGGVDEDGMVLNH